jgi:hypothetical protein
MNDGFWKLITAVCLGAMIYVIYAISTGSTGSISRSVVEQIIPAVLPAGNVIETANATILKLDRESQLVTATAYVQAVVRKKDEQIYGNAEIARIVPARIHYALNLAEIDRRRIEYDPQNKILWVPLPDVKIQSIDPDTEKSEIIRSIDLLRTESGIGNQLELETERMVRPALEKMGASPDIVKFAKDQAIISVRQLMEAPLEAAGQTVKVKPYFLSDGKGLPARPAAEPTR